MNRCYGDPANARENLQPPATTVAITHAAFCGAPEADSATPSGSDRPQSQQQQGFPAESGSAGSGQQQGRCHQVEVDAEAVRQMLMVEEEQQLMRQQLMRQQAAEARAVHGRQD